MSSSFIKTDKDAKGSFHIEYATPGSFANGTYFQDTVRLGSLKLDKANMALVKNSSSLRTGILGLGMDINESDVGSKGLKPYPNFVDQLVTYLMAYGRTPLSDARKTGWLPSNPCNINNTRDCTYSKYVVRFSRARSSTGL